jgi:hypothetical protein
MAVAQTATGTGADLGPGEATGFIVEGNGAEAVIGADAGVEAGGAAGVEEEVVIVPGTEVEEAGTSAPGTEVEEMATRAPGMGTKIVVDTMDMEEVITVKMRRIEALKTQDVRNPQENHVFYLLFLAAVCSAD